MFWRLGFQQTSPVEAILDKSDFELEELLEEDELLQECKAINRKLITYLARPEIVERLISYCTIEPPADAEMKVRIKYPHIASELLSADMQAVYDTLFSNDNLINQLFSFLDGSGPENAVMAGYFSKIVNALLSRKPIEVLNEFRSRNVLQSCLRHIRTYSMVEIILRVISEIEDTTNPKAESDVQWIRESSLMMQLLDKLNDSDDPQVHQNVSACLSGILKDTPRLSPSSFVTQLASADCVKRLLDHVFAGSSSALMAGLTVLVELLKVNSTPNGTLFNPSDLVSQVLCRLADFVGLLQNPPPMAAIVNTAGKLDPPLGSNRLMVVEVLLAMVTMNNDQVNEAIVNHNIVFTCLDLFIKYPWNNLLHNLVEKMLSHIMSASPAHLRMSMFADNKIIDWALDAHRKNQDCVRTIGTRIGFAAQLQVIANAIIAAANADPAIAKIVTAHDDWKDFVEKEVIPRNELEERLLGGHKPASANNNSNNSNNNNNSSSDEQPGPPPMQQFLSSLSSRDNESESDKQGSLAGSSEEISNNMAEWRPRDNLLAGDTEMETDSEMQQASPPSDMQTSPLNTQDSDDLHNE